MLWEYGGYASDGVKQVAELGSPVKMEEEIRQKVRSKASMEKKPGFSYGIANCFLLLLNVRRVHVYMRGKSCVHKGLLEPVKLRSSLIITVISCEISAASDSQFS